MLGDSVRLDFVTAMMDLFKSNKLLDIATIVEITPYQDPPLAGAQHQPHRGEHASHSGGRPARTAGRPVRHF